MAAHKEGRHAQGTQAAQAQPAGKIATLINQGRLTGWTKRRLWHTLRQDAHAAPKGSLASQQATWRSLLTCAAYGAEAAAVGQHLSDAGAAVVVPAGGDGASRQVVQAAGSGSDRQWQAVTQLGAGSWHPGSITPLQCASVQ